MGDQDWRGPYGPRTRAKRGVETNNNQHLGGGRGGLGRPNLFAATAEENDYLFSSPPSKPDEQPSPYKKQKTSSVSYCANNSPSTPPPASSSSGGSSVVMSIDGHSGSKPPTAPISPVLYPQDSINSSQSPSAATGLSGERIDQRGEIDNFKAHLKPFLLRRLTDLSKKEVACKVGHEMVESILTLKLMLDCTDPELETVSQKSSRGAILIEEGEKLVKEAQTLLSAAMAKNAYAS